MDIVINGSMMRKLVEHHKTAEGEKCVRAIVSVDGRNVKFVDRLALEQYEPDQIVSRFDRCPACGRPFE